MSRPTSPVVCDGPGCGKQKQETNRWWQAAIDQRVSGPNVRVHRGLRLAVFDVDEPRTLLEWAGWTWYDFCGETCTLKFISEQMGKVTS